MAISTKAFNIKMVIVSTYPYNYQFEAIGPFSQRMASVIFKVCRIGPTSWTRTICAPRMTPAVTVAAVPISRCAGGACNICPIKDFRDVPNKIGHCNIFNLFK